MSGGAPVCLTRREAWMAAQAGLYRYMQSCMCGWGGKNGQSPDAMLSDMVQGAMAELAVCKLLGRYWSGQTDAGFADVPGGLEVRQSAQPSAHLLLKPNDSPAPTYVLVTGALVPVAGQQRSKGVACEFVVRGMIKGEDIVRRFPLEDRLGNGRPCRWVPQSALLPISELRDLTADVAF